MMAMGSAKGAAVTAVAGGSLRAAERAGQKCILMTCVKRTSLGRSSKWPVTAVVAVASGRANGGAGQRGDSCRQEEVISRGEVDRATCDFTQPQRGRGTGRLMPPGVDERPAWTPRVTRVARDSESGQVVEDRSASETA